MGVKVQMEKYELDKTNEEELLKNAVIVFDTSALLELYIYSEESQNDIFNSIFKIIKERVWIPAQVEFEFSKNRAKVLHKPIQVYKDLIHIRKIKTNDLHAKGEKGSNDSGYVEKIETLISSIKNNTLEDINGNMKTLIEKTVNKKVKKHPFFEKEVFSEITDKISCFEKNIDKLINDFEMFKCRISAEVDSRIKDLKSNEKTDLLFNKITETFKIGEEFSYAETLEVVREGELRYRNSVPPGYKDLKDKIGFQIYGDLICWKQIIKHMKNLNKPVILVSNDKKEDWIEEVHDIKMPRYELIKEFWSETNNQFWIYDMHTFIYKIQSALGIKLKNSVNNEINLIKNETRNLKFISSLKLQDIEKVCEYAKNRSKLDYKYGLHELSNTTEGLNRFFKYYETEEGKIVKEAEKKLEDYLDGLDFETIKTIQTIMYLGMDEDYNEEDVPEQRYLKLRQYLDEQGWNKKHIEVRQITQKIHLDEYLINGLKILKIEI